MTEKQWKVIEEKAQEIIGNRDGKPVSDDAPLHNVIIDGYVISDPDQASQIAEVARQLAIEKEAAVNA